VGGVRGDALADQRHLCALPAGRKDEARVDDQEQQDVLPALGNHPRGQSAADPGSSRAGDAGSAPDHAGGSRRQRAAGRAGEVRGLVPGRRRRGRPARVRGLRARVGRQARAADRPRPRDGEGLHRAAAEGSAPGVAATPSSCPSTLIVGCSLWLRQGRPVAASLCQYTCARRPFGNTVRMAKTRQVVLEVAGREVAITNPEKVFFPRAGHTKLDLARYYAAVAEGALRGIAGRPIVLKRYVDGAEGEPFFQKRAPEQHPEWVETVELSFPSGRTARGVGVREPAQLLWTVSLRCIALNPPPGRAADLEHPDELRVALDPGPGTSWDDVRRVALVVRDVLGEHDVRGWPKTSGSRGIHVYVRLERRWSFDQVRRATLAVAREVERRAAAPAPRQRWEGEGRGGSIDSN